MSFDFVDGCDYNSTDNTNLNRKWPAIAAYSGLNFNLTNGLSAHDVSSGGCISITNGSSSWKGISLRVPERRAASEDYCLHYWYKARHFAGSNSASQILVFTNAIIASSTGSYSGFKSGNTAYTIVELRLLTTGYLQLLLNGTVLATATQTQILDATFHCFRIKINIDGSAGAFQLYVDSNSTPDIDYTGALYTGGGEGFDDIVFATDTNTADSHGYYIDDVIAYVPGGDAPSALYSEPKLISTSVPTSDAAPNDGTPSTGTTHYNLLDELPPSASDYVNIPATAGDAEMFGFGSGVVVPSGATGIDAVVITTWGTASGSTSHSVKGRCDSSATTGYGVTKDVVPGALAAVQSFINVDPNTSAAWTESGVNAAKFGVELVA